MKKNKIYKITKDTKPQYVKWKSIKFLKNDLILVKTVIIKKHL
jgi:hypothetical protein